MIKIAIVDDDLEMCNYIKKELALLLSDVIEFRSYTFENADQFSKSLNCFYDIVLLDIDMPGINGLDMAENLRRQKIQSVIIYITSKIEYMPKAFGLNIFGFIDKKDIKSEFSLLLQQCIACIEQNISLTLRTNEGKVRVLTDTIIYAEFVNRKVSLYTTCGYHEINFPSLHNLYEMIDHKSFIYINRGTIINLKHLISIKNKEAKLCGVNFTIPISKYQEINEIWMEYISKRGII